MKRYLLYSLALVALVATARADDEKKAEPAAPDSYKSLTAEWSKAQREFSTLYRAAKTNELVDPREAIELISSTNGLP